MERKCPRCGFVGEVEKYFGWRCRGIDKYNPQSYCRSCRAEREAPPSNMIWSREKITEKYKEAYPNDKNNSKRSVTFMVTKLNRKLVLKITPQ